MSNEVRIGLLSFVAGLVLCTIPSMYLAEHLARRAHCQASAQTAEYRLAAGRQIICQQKVDVK